jgi:outer membrane protein assembly factor BamB
VGKNEEILLGAIVAASAVVVALSDYQLKTSKLVAVDSAKVAVRFKLPLPDHVSRGSLIAQEGLVVMAIDTDGNNLLAVDAHRGRKMWEARIEGWQSHSFLGGRLVCETRKGFSVLRPDTGAVVAAWPPPAS